MKSNSIYFKFLIFFILFLNNMTAYSTEFLYEKASLKNSTPLYMGLAMGSAGLYSIYQMEDISEEYINNLDKYKINFIDRWVVSNYSKESELLSDILLIYHAVMPLFLISQISDNDDIFNYIYMYSEVQIFNAGLNGLTKGLVRRNRPFMYNKSVPLDKKYKKDGRLSFYSGHTSFSFVSAVFVSKMFSNLKINTDLDNYVWGFNLITAGLTGYLRVNSGKHFLSDVLVGAVVGSVIGYYLPEFRKKDRIENVNIRSIPIFSMNIKM